MTPTRAGRAPAPDARTAAGAPVRPAVQAARTSRTPRTSRTAGPGTTARNHHRTAEETHP
ncbi:hypothetical protein [Streptomyces sp. NPDC001568]|uniref:hypothetical protein n=1 Tax=Streptomyces sp. NPDC001568 TaxID=3364588 RepID=UPI0036CFC260